MYRTWQFGGLVELLQLDQRQFRDEKVCGRDMVTSRCKEAEAADRTMLGDAQREWFLNGLGASRATWKFMLSELMFAPLKVNLLAPFGQEIAAAAFGGGATQLGNFFVSLDQWDGYPAERETILKFVDDHRIRNLVVLSGDIHAAFDAKCLRDGAPASSAASVHEVVTTSISSNSLGDNVGSYVGRNNVQGVITRSNPHCLWSDTDLHGYTLLTATPASLVVEHVTVDTVEKPAADRALARTWTLGARG
jgi:alkaline phosphatase D